MWDELLKHSAGFSSAVLTGVDAEGYPFSVRCVPGPASGGEHRLEVDVGEWTGIGQGPAGLLYHRHDERLWNLRSLIVRGRLDRDDAGRWLFTPEQLVPGAGIGGLPGMVRFLRDGRRTTKRYLKKRGLERPQIPWEKVKAVWAEIDAEGRRGAPRAVTS